MKLLGDISVAQLIMTVVSAAMGFMIHSTAQTAGVVGLRRKPVAWV